MRFVRSALPAMWRASIATMLQYRGEIVLWAVWGIIYPAVAFSMWTVAGNSPGASAALRSYSRGDLAAYFLVTMMVTHFCAAWDAFEMGYLVRSGRLSPALLRPLLPMWESVANNLAYKVVTLVILIPLWIVAGWLLKPNFSASFVQCGLGALALALAAVLNYLLGYCIALASFWTTKNDAIGELWFGGSLLFGGRSAPLALLPGPLQWVAAVLPFKWIFWFPTEAIIGRLSTAEILIGLVTQLGWLAVGVVVFRLTWARAVQRYAAVGA